MLIGKQTWEFQNRPVVISTGVVGGPFEAEGKRPSAFDILHDNLWLEQQSFEQAQQLMMEEASEIALKKANLHEGQIEFLLTGDLINQITPSTLAASTLQIPYFGLFSACATSTEGLALAALFINTNSANYVLTGTASHYAATERQFRFPNEYGGQKPPTAQRTVTGAGCAIIAKEGNGPFITSATIGKVVDLGVTDPFNMGAAMAPAAVDTIVAHLKDRNLTVDHYDLIITGDLGHIGRDTSFELLKQKGINIQEEQYVDCGIEVYEDDQSAFAGGSGTACSAVMTYGHFIQLLTKKELKRILVVATGSLHSPLTVQQNLSIPCIAHAVSIEI